MPSATAQEARAATGATLAADPGVEMSDGLRELVAAGGLDLRAMQVLAAHAGGTAVAVGGMPAIDGEDGGVRRQLVLESLDGQPLVDPGADGADPALTPTGEAVLAGLTGDLAPASFAATAEGLLLQWPVALDGGRAS